MRRLIAFAVPALVLALAVTLPAGTARSATLDQEDLAAIEQLVSKGVAKRLAPIRKELAEMNQESVGPTEIAGGIGYLIGLGGLFAYAASRRRKD